ncbi:na+ dependent nucleoside transporter family domain protein [Burkholderia sp. ABCPW 111]|nr:na+ dependent nucleoside transporter family domain protein [Burkholderia sp. ABCPW 111]
MRGPPSPARPAGWPARSIGRTGASVQSSDENITCAAGERQWSNRSANERCAPARFARGFGCQRDFGEVGEGRALRGDLAIWRFGDLAI